VARRPRDPADVAQALRDLAAAIERAAELPAGLGDLLEQARRLVPTAETPWEARIRRGIERGLTPSQAAGKPQPGEVPASQVSGRPLRGAAREAVSARTPRGHWSAPTPGGTVDMRTRGRVTLVRALRRARRQGREVMVSVEADEIEFGDYATRRHRGDNRAHTGRTDPSALLRVIEAHGGDVEAGLAYWFATHEDTSVSGITEYSIKSFS